MAIQLGVSNISINTSQKFLGNERWLNGSWVTSRSVPVNIPDTFKEKLDITSSMEFNSLTFDISNDAQGEYSGSYGRESLPSICEYGTHINHD